MDVWSHLRTGIWILQNHAVPRTGLFSQYHDLPWMAHSWGFDVLLAAAYKLTGLRALPVLLMVFRVALALVFFLLARGSRQNFWPAVLLAAFAQYPISGLQLQPALCSILLYAIELALLFHARRTGSSTPTALAAAVVRHLGKPGHPVCLRLVGNVSALGGARRGGDRPPLWSTLAYRTFAGHAARGDGSVDRCFSLRHPADALYLPWLCGCAEELWPIGFGGVSSRTRCSRLPAAGGVRAFAAGDDGVLFFGAAPRA